MGNFTIYKENCGDFTIISNCFIDNYMTEANDAQIKVYLYLMRAFHSHMTTSVSDMADKFNHTEKDIIRALKYWEKQKLLSLDYDASKNLTGIHILDKTSEIPSCADIVPVEAPVVSASPVSVSPAGEDRFEKPSYSLDDLKAFQAKEETEQLLFIVEQYIGKPLTATEIKTILFITDRLRFSSDLTDYLVQYCVDRGKRDFRYIEKVAISWAEQNITTPKQAKAHARKYDKTVYAVMKSLGKSGVPTAKEVSYISHWTKDLGFTLDVINEACERTVLAVDKHRFEYADSILANWSRSNIHSMSDIKTADEAYRKSTVSARPRNSLAKNQFNQFPQRDYDFDELEKELLSN